jgi:predicted branched-subunit amino acid permease
MIAYDAAAYPLNQNEWSFPVCEVFHIVSFAIAISTVFMVDLRLLGVAFKNKSASTLLKDTAPWTLLGLVVVLISGPLIFFSDPIMYLYNLGFRFKITALLLAILFNYTVHRKVAMSDSSGAVASLTAVVSLALWVSVVAGGIFIAFV